MQIIEQLWLFFISCHVNHSAFTSFVYYKPYTKTTVLTWALWSQQRNNRWQAIILESNNVRRRIRVNSPQICTSNVQLHNNSDRQLPVCIELTLATKWSYYAKVKYIQYYRIIGFIFSWSATVNELLKIFRKRTLYPTTVDNVIIVLYTTVIHQSLHLPVRPVIVHMPW